MVRTLRADDEGAELRRVRHLVAVKQDLSLDLPMRPHAAPTGVDERLIAEVVECGALRGVERL